MTKRAAPKPENVSRGAYRGWPPECMACGFTGCPCQESSPYIACGGDPAKHQRTPLELGVRT